MSIFFSIVVPTYNREKLIKKTLISLLDQGYRNFEIIVVDDGSTDNTEEVVKSLRHEKIMYVKKKNAERAAARNAGAAVAKGDYINFFDSDDLAYPYHLSEAAEMIDKFNSPEIFHLAYEVRDSNGKLIQKARQYQEEISSRLYEGCLVGCNGMFVRTDIAKAYPFNEDIHLSASEDYELWLRLSSRFPLYHSNRATSMLINHSERSVLQVNKEKLIRRQEVFLKYIWQDIKVQERFSRWKRFMEAETYTYIALHLSLTKKYRKEVLGFLAKSFFTYPGVLTRRRFWATIKHLL